MCNQSNDPDDHTILKRHSTTYVTACVAVLAVCVCSLTRTLCCMLPFLTLHEAVRFNSFNKTVPTPVSLFAWSAM